MDAITLDGLLGEIVPRVRGRVVRRVRAAGAQAVLLEVERVVLWLDVGRETAGLYALDRARADRLRQQVPGEPDPRSRQALLHLRKHLEGRRLADVRRVAGARVVACDMGDATLWLRVARPPVLTLAVGEAPLASFGGEPAWPPPAADPARSWPRLTADRVATAVAAGDRATRALLEACPELGPLAQRLARDPARWLEWRDDLARPRPRIVVPRALDELADADLAEPGAIHLRPVSVGDETGRVVVESREWIPAAATALELHVRASRFAARRRPLLDAAAGRVRRQVQLERHLADDLAGLPDESALRRAAEALLASGVTEAASDAIDVPDPYDPATPLRVRVDPQRTIPANADRLFEKARRTSRARVQVAERLEQARAALARERAAEERLRAARNVADLPEPGSEGDDGPSEGAPRRYLTSRGLDLLVGRGARENHELTFKVARPEDFWLHARDVPGAHVILRDPERRATAEDRREAAEVAAFFSAARENARVDVHVARRKHVRPGGGGAGRVRVNHSETERVAPRDPDGRLRRR